MNVLGIGLDYLMLKKDNVRGDVRDRQLDYASRVNSFNLVVYSPENLAFKAERWSNNLWIHPTSSKNKARFIFDALRITSQICKEKKIDVITTEDPFTTGLVGYLLKKKFNIPLNIQAHIDFCNNKYWIEQRKINRVFNILGKFIIRNADTIRIGTNFEKEKISRSLNISKDKISVIPVNSDLSKFKNADGSLVRKQYLNSCFDKMLLFSGRLVKQKDIPTLLRAFQIVLKSKPRTLLMILGTGVEEGYLRKLIGELRIGSNVLFRGSIEHNLIPQYLAACDIYTISSVFEGTCIAMVEAMAAEKPIVATKFSGANDLVIDKDTGFLIEQRNYVDFAKAALYLLDNPSEAKRMGQIGSQRIESMFSDNQNIEKMIELWEKTAQLG